MITALCTIVGMLAGIALGIWYHKNYPAPAEMLLNKLLRK